MGPASSLAAAWIVANVRSLRLDDAAGTAIVAEIDFLGEGDEERLTGKLYNFRRGVTRYPIPGATILPVTTEDMRSIFAADDSPHVVIGTVYPTDDIRGTRTMPRPSRRRAAAG